MESWEVHGNPHVGARRAVGYVGVLSEPWKPSAVIHLPFSFQQQLTGSDGMGKAGDTGIGVGVRPREAAAAA